MLKRNIIFALFGLHPIRANNCHQQLYELVVLVAFVLNFCTFFLHPSFKDLISNWSVKSYMAFFECN